MAKWLIPQEKNVNDVEETKEQKVNAMLAIRKMVKDHITGKNKGNVPYLAKLDLSPADNVRMVIALQDLVDKERGKRLAAQGHIVELIGIKEQLMEQCIQISEASLEQSRRLSHATQTITGLNEQAARQEARIRDQDRQIKALLKALGGQDEPVSYPATPMTDMGSSNRASDRHGNSWALKERG